MVPWWTLIIAAWVGAAIGLMFGCMFRVSGRD